MMVHQYNDPGYRLMNMLNLAGFLARSSVNGPGIRAVVWVQGCPLRCTGCFNEQFQSFSPAQMTDVGNLAGRILSIEGIEGVTFSGGEPFSQAGPLAELGRRLRNAGLSIVTYSGYTGEELGTGTDPEWPALLAVTDLLIAGPYVAGLTRSQGLAGSGNQQVIPLGTRIRPDPENCPGEYPAGMTEFSIDTNGTITTSGFPEQALLRQITSRCGGM
jgi:anaerobic ribonucleoside-triphosphate reductase activating protein